MPGVRLWGYRAALKINPPKYPITVVVICNENWRPRVHVEVENEYAGGKKKPLAWHLGTTTMLCDRPTGMDIQRFIFSLIIDHTFSLSWKQQLFLLAILCYCSGWGLMWTIYDRNLPQKEKKKTAKLWTALLVFDLFKMSFIKYLSRQ